MTSPRCSGTARRSSSSRARPAAGAPSSALKNADFEGIAIHCAQADSADNGVGNHTLAVLAAERRRRRQACPTSPAATAASTACSAVSTPTRSHPAPARSRPRRRTRAGAAHGNINDLAAPVKDVYNYSSPGCPFCANGTNLDYKGQPIISNVIGDSSGNSGFVTGFSPTPAQTLGYVASMQEAGIPVSFAYIEDAHNKWNAPFNALGPGDPTYVDQLKQQQQAFQAFFERLAADGINKTNTLFVFTADEGDHFAGTTPTNPGCDGVNTPCTYPANGVGEQTALINDALAKESGDTHSFAIHFDDAPNFYVGGPAGSTAPPGPYDGVGASARAGSRRADPDQPGERCDRAGHAASRRRGGSADPAHDDDRPAADAVIHRLRRPDVLLPDRHVPDEQRRGRLPGRQQRVCVEPRWRPAGGRRAPGWGWSDRPSRTSDRRDRCGPTTPTSARRCSSTLGLHSDYEQDGAALTQLMAPSSIPGGRVRAPHGLSGSGGRVHAARTPPSGSSATTPRSCRRPAPRARHRATPSRRASTSSCRRARPSGTRSPAR